jgi:hypothetical protein
VPRAGPEQVEQAINLARNRWQKFVELQHLEAFGTVELCSPWEATRLFNSANALPRSRRVWSQRSRLVEGPLGAMLANHTKAAG